MKMVMRWFGPAEDSIPLAHIRQVPGVSGIAGALHGLSAGEAWPAEMIEALKAEIGAAGLEFEVVESLNVHEDIKLGLPSRDRWIESYALSLRRLGTAGVKVVCYNFMPVLDWFRTDLAKLLPDGSKAFYYDAAEAGSLKPEEVVRRIDEGSRGFKLPGWEGERLARLGELFEAYAGIDEEKLLANLGYFLEAILPVCEEAGLRMAIHPDDPPWPIFGLPRIVTDAESLRRILELADRPENGLALCSGSLGANPANDIPAIVREFSGRGRVPYAHIRNIRFTGGGSFIESSHLSSEGSLDLYEIVKAYRDTGFEGYIRSDHGRTIWGEEARPGYGLYDRALGTAYLNGLWEAVGKARGQEPGATEEGRPR
jgi:mannonate dehydratase